MDIEKILSLLEDCFKLLKRPLTGDQNKISYAFEFILILIGETIHMVIEEIQQFVFKDEVLFFKLLKDSGTAFDEGKIREDKDYRVQKFRTVFNKHNIGKNLSLLNFLRNEIKHSFIYLTEEDHKKIRMLYFKVEPISNFIKDFNALVEKYKEDSSGLVNTIFSNKEISVINIDEVKVVEKLFKEGKKIVTNKQTFEDQKQATLDRVQLILELMNKLVEYSKKLDEVRKFKGHEADLYAPLMCITGIGVNCIKLIEYRKKDSVFHEAIRKILKDNNDLFAPFSFLATRYTHQIHALPRPRQAYETCESILKEKANFEKLALTIKLLNIPSAEEESGAEDEKEVPEPKPLRSKSDEKEKKKEEKEGKMPKSTKSIIQVLQTSGSPLHTHHPKKEKNPMPQDEIDEIFDQAKRKITDKEAHTKHDESKKRRGEPEQPRKKGI